MVRIIEHEAALLETASAVSGVRIWQWVRLTCSANPLKKMSRRLVFKSRETNHIDSLSIECSQ